VLAELHTDFPERFEQRRKLYAWNGGSDRRELRVENHWPHKGGMVFKFEGVDSIEAAEKLVRAEIQIPLNERAELEVGACYISELLGCMVIADAADGQVELGRIADVNFGAGAAPLLIVNDARGKEFMVPFVEGFLRKLDLPAKRIEMQLPEGMLELDAPLSAEKKPREKKLRTAKR
jgi:16S rRNA processing protein RimM